METETISSSEISKERVKIFKRNMRARWLDGPTRGKLDTFLLLTFDQATEKDTINFLSWAKDSSRSNIDHIKTVLSFLEFPEIYNHPPSAYQRIDMDYYESIIPRGEERVPLIALGIGPNGRTVLYRLKGLHTKDCFKRIKKAAGL